MELFYRVLLVITPSRVHLRAPYVQWEAFHWRHQALVQFVLRAPTLLSLGLGHVYVSLWQRRMRTFRPIIYSLTIIFLLKACSAGNYCFNGTMVACSSGSYQPSTGGISCIQCPAGRFCPSAGSTTASMCPEGMQSLHPDCPPLVRTLNLWLLLFPRPKLCYRSF
jgi:hypothetical protein